MKRNVGGGDRWVRLLAGPALLVAGLKKGGKLGLVLSGAGVVLLTTGATEHCPVNSALGIDTSE